MGLSGHGKPTFALILPESVIILSAKYSIFWINGEWPNEQDHAHFRLSSYFHVLCLFDFLEVMILLVHMCT
jgi:hypothetical protein